MLRVGVQLSGQFAERSEIIVGDVLVVFNKLLVSSCALSDFLELALEIGMKVDRPAIELLKKLRGIQFPCDLIGSFGVFSHYKHQSLFPRLIPLLT